MERRQIELKPASTDISSKFNEQFLRMGVADTYVNDGFQNYLPNPTPFSMYCPPTNRSEIEYFIKSVESTASGYDDISPKVLKQFINHIYSISSYIQCILKIRYFPR